MKIIHFEASPGWGGQEIRILREAEGMRSRGHSVFFAVMKGGGLVSQACKAGFTVYEIDFYKKSWIITFWRLIQILRENQIDIINTHSSLDSWVGGLVARFLKIPIVRTRHLSTPIKPGWNSRLLYGTLADFIVTTCSSILPMIAKQSGKSLLSMKCIATGVDPARMQWIDQQVKEFRKSLCLSDKDCLIGTACFMRSWKGINDFLEAANILRNEPNLKWVIIGGGHQELYRQRAKDLRLENIVYFTGHLPDPIYAIQTLDVFALLSTAHEGISQAILQAAYLGKPLIATPVGGSCEVCLDCKTGIIVPAFAPEKVAEAVLLLMRNSEMRIRLGQEARNRVLQNFTMQHTLDEMEAVYRKIVR